MKTVLITEADGGIGNKLAEVFAANRYDLILNGRNICPPDYRSYGILQHNVIGNIISGDTIGKLTRYAEEKDLDVLVNNVGKGDKDVDSVISLTRSIWPIFQKKNSGVIININSIKHTLREVFDSLQFKALQYYFNVRVINVYLETVSTNMSVDRIGREEFISPYDVADFIYTISNMNYSSMRITDVDLKRRRYD